jgi:hypothetical protein
MAKVSIIPLSAATEMTDAKKEDKTFYSVREIELAILENLFVVAANMQKDIRKTNVCWDLIQEVKAIKDDQINFKISGSDLKELLIPAFEKTAESRPGVWYYSRKMFKAI